MKDLIPPSVLKIHDSLEKNNFEAYFVGGSVRNIILNLPVKDWDLTTNATPEQILKLFPDGYYNNDFGTVGIPLDEKTIVEVTTYRTEQGFSNKRHPDKVAWGKTIEEDLSRRDFTINAIALRFPKDKQAEPEFIDPYDGQTDIKNKIIRTVGAPSERFKEDALRLLRAIRFATVLSFDIDDATGKELVEDAPLIQQISYERIRDELLKILASENPSKGILLLKDAGLLKFIIPELLEGINVSQVRPGRHHTTDVFTHNIMSLKYCPSVDPIVRFATLIHDVGKPKVRGEDNDGLVTFYNHEVAGAKLAYEICERLKFSKIERNRVISLIRWHMFSVDDKITDAAVRRFIRRIGVENVKDLIDLRIGDRLGSGTETAESWRLKLFKDRIEKELAPAAFSINDLAIDGNDVMKILNIKPGKEIGEILQKLYEEIDEDQSKNTKEYLTKRVKEISA
ncbi:MAG: HD domain-containing protein [Candidatus Levybacteria bacterium]|nr:HD domain-containing protein [Candidatus Levybacteria bacterium]